MTAISQAYASARGSVIPLVIIILGQMSLAASEF